MLPGLPSDPVAPPDEALWRLVKGRRVAVCWQRRHPLGFELRLDVSGETLRTTVERTAEAAHEQSAYMRDAMTGKGWTQPA